MQYLVTFKPAGREGKVAAGKSLWEVAVQLGVELVSFCGGSHFCGKCKVKIMAGEDGLSPLTPAEAKFLTPAELADGWRLACFARVEGEVTVYVPANGDEAEEVILTAGRSRHYELDPAIKKYYLTLTPPTLSDRRAELTRLKKALAEKIDGGEALTADLSVLQNLPGAMRQEDGKITVSVWQGREILRVEAGFQPENYGVAVDVGTTSLVVYLCDLTAGRVLGRSSMMNPQVSYGADVLARITYSMTEGDGLTRMREAVVAGINQLIGEVAAAHQVTGHAIGEAVVVLNTTMHHLFLGIEPRYLGSAPFVPAVKDALDFKARELGVAICPSGNIHLLPVAAGFVGSDHLAALIAEAPHQGEELRLIMDIGTNGEISLGNRQGLWTTSCATGPALEGAQIKFGMRAAAGAVEKVQIDSSTWEASFKVVGEADWHTEQMGPSVKGICGSGIIDVMAEMLQAGIINKNGSFNREKEHPRLRVGAEGAREYVLVWAKDTLTAQDLTITQADVRAVQLAKGALYVGAKFLSQQARGGPIQGISLAGAFGSYINPANAARIGMFPDLDLSAVQVVGNAAGDGAQLALFDRKKREEARELAGKIQYVDTALEEDFMYEFAYAMDFPHARDTFPRLNYSLAQSSYTMDRRR